MPWLRPRLRSLPLLIQSPLRRRRLEWTRWAWPPSQLTECERIKSPFFVAVIFSGNCYFCIYKAIEISIPKARAAAYNKQASRFFFHVHHRQHSPSGGYNFCRFVACPMEQPPAQISPRSKDESHSSVISSNAASAATQATYAKVFLNPLFILSISYMFFSARKYQRPQHSSTRHPNC